VNGLTERKERREAILGLQRVMESMPQIQTEAIHHFAHGVYVREFRARAGSLVVGKLHRYSCVNIILEGSAEVRTEDESLYLTAGDVFVSKPGAKRAVMVTEDIRWLTVHPAGTQDLEVLENELIAPSFDDLPPRMLEADL
jgi:uncharacterized cupin superfamily protein